MKIFSIYVHADLKKICNKTTRTGLICTLFFVFALNCLAINTYSQTISLQMRVDNTNFKKAITEIKKQTQYDFIYSKEVESLFKKTIQLDVNNASLETVLDQLFSRNDIDYKVENKTIILTARKKADGNQAEKGKVIVSGVVSDSEGGVPGVNVVEKGTKNGVTCDIDGKYSLTVSGENAVLVFSFVGYANVEKPVGSKRVIDVVMQEDARLINEVVVTALGLKKEAKSLSYNVQQLSASEVTKVPDVNFMNSLNGKVAGVTINSSSSGVGGSSRVVMRGTKSLSGNNNALYVIDGVPMLNISIEQPDDLFSGAGQSGDALANINSDDIESISVLSGPSAAALYGSAAANGVVLVTTKKGEEGRVSINVSNSTTFSAPLILPEFQNRYGQSEEGSFFSWGEKLDVPSGYQPKDFFQTGYYVSNSINMSTGTSKNQTYVSFAHTDSEGIIPNNEYQRYNFSLRNTTKYLDEKMTLDLQYSLSDIDEKNMIAQGQYHNPLLSIYLFPPADDFQKVKIFERYNASRNFETQFWPYDDGMGLQNPYWITDREKFLNKKSRHMLTGSLRYEFEKGINLSGRVKLDQGKEQYERKFNASTNTLFASKTGYYSLNEITSRQMYGEVLLNIDKYLLDNQLNVIANIGANIDNIQYDQNLYGGKLAKVPNLFTYSNVNLTTSESSQTGHHIQRQSAFASAQLGYKGLAYLDVTARNDWPSTLAGSSTSSFFYPSVGLSGIVTDIFKIDTPVLPYMKVRVSYSEVGNEPMYHITIPTYRVSNGIPVTQTRMPNPDLEPERTKSWELGANFGFFRNKLKIDATFYQSKTYNQFFEPTLSASSGYTSVIVNAGRIDNKGVELSVKYDERWGEIAWNTFLTYSLNQNKIVSLLDSWKNPVTGEIISLSELNMGGTGSYSMLLKEGGSMGDVYVNSLRTDEHGAIYVDPTSQTVVAESNELVYAGNAAPKYNIGWGNMLGWKGLSLSFLFSARVGGVVVSNTQAIMDAYGVSKASADARDAGGALVNGKRIPAKEYYQTIGSATGGIGSMYVYSATNIRLGELTVGYDVPVNKWTTAVKGLNVSFIGRNLFFIYNKAPYDPEVTASTGTYFQGIDYFMQPSLRNLGFSVKLRF